MSISEEAEVTARSIPILSARGLRKTFPGAVTALGRRTPVVAVDDVSFDLQVGECLGLVGESGSGKSTVARIAARLETADAGQVMCNGVDWTAEPSRRLRKVRASMQMVFQNPFASLNPMMTAADIIEEPIVVHRLRPKREIHNRILELTDLVGLSGQALDKYPHEFSGGQRQRLAIARALAAEPRVIIADEAVSALDVSTQAKILNLFKDVLEIGELSLLFITHDLAVVRQICDRVTVMKGGKVVEERTADDLFDSPSTDYTRALLETAPRI